MIVRVVAAVVLTAVLAALIVELCRDDWRPRP